MRIGRRTVLGLGMAGLVGCAPSASGSPSVVPSPSAVPTAGASSSAPTPSPQPSSVPSPSPSTLPLPGRDELVARYDGVTPTAWGLEIDGVVLISPNFGLKARGAFVLNLPLARYWLPLIAGRERCMTPKNEKHRDYWTSCYPIVSLLPVELILQVGSSAGFAMVFALLIAAI